MSSMMSFATTPWTNGAPNRVTGSGYGVRIPRDARDQLFRKSWKHVVLRTEDGDFSVPITATFWTTCNELRSRDIGQWLIKHGRHTWTKGKPPALRITHIGGNKFSLFCS